MVMCVKNPQPPASLSEHGLSTRIHHQVAHGFALDYFIVIGAPPEQSAAGYCLPISLEVATNRNANPNGTLGPYRD